MIMYRLLRKTGFQEEGAEKPPCWAKNGFSVIRKVEQEEGTILLAEKCR